MGDLFDIGKAGINAYKDSLAATGQNIANLAMNFVMSDNTKIVSELEQIHELLNQNSSVKSAEAVMEFLHG